MSTYQGHYLPVEARREVLRIYRDRRTRGPLGIAGPMPPLDAMRATVDYFSGWLASAVAFGPVGPETVESLTGQYRAAEFYLDRMYQKPVGFRRRWSVVSR